MKICYFTASILLTSFKINTHRHCGPSGSLEEGLSMGHWRPLVAIRKSATSHIVFPEKQACCSRVKNQKAQFIEVSLPYTAHFVPLRAGRHSGREAVYIMGVKLSPRLGLVLGLSSSLAFGPPTLITCKRIPWKWTVLWLLPAGDHGFQASQPREMRKHQRHGQPLLLVWWEILPMECPLCISTHSLLLLL